MFEIMSLKLFGERCRNLLKSVMVSIVVYTGLINLGQNIPVTHRTLMLINLSFSASVIIQFLGSKDNADYLKGYFAMPFDRKHFISGYAAVTGIYVLLTRTMIVYAFILAFTKISVTGILLILSEYIFVCLGAMTAFAFFSDRKYISLALAAAGAVICFILPESPVTIGIYLALSVLLMFVLFNTDPYRFMVSKSEKQSKIKSSKGGGFLIPKYIFRYILSNRSYLITPLVMLAFVCFFVVSMKNTGINGGELTGIALLTVNTPLGIIVSSNRGLHKKLDSMPSEIRYFFLPYACFMFGYYIVMNAVFLTIVSFLGVDITVKTILTAVLFPIQAAAATAYMEDKKTLTLWRVETDLWHHPRKYIVPGILILEAGILMFV